MLKCAHCGAAFEEPAQLPGQVLDCGGAPCRGEHTPICPVCGGDELDGCQLCAGCCQWFAPDELEQGFCRACGGQVLGRFRQMMTLQFSGAEREYLNWVLDGLRL